MLQSSINGSISGVFAKTIVYPFDLAKKRLQIQGFEDARKNFGKVVKFTGLFNCFYLTFKHEGIFGIYKGYYPSMIKAAVYSGLIFLFYESFSNMVRGIKENEKKDS
jgi:solute carrier family 25 thiamine pyrophosphate transporter 19